MVEKISLSDIAGYSDSPRKSRRYKSIHGGWGRDKREGCWLIQMADGTFVAGHMGFTHSHLDAHAFENPAVAERTAERLGGNVIHKDDVK